MAEDRSGWNPFFDLDYRRGQVGEELVGTFLENLNGGLIEVKTDYRAGMTGNVYIETWQQDGAGGWKESGLNLSKANFYAIAGPGATGFIVIRSEELKALARVAPERTISASNVNTVNTRGRLVKLVDILAVVFRA